MLPSSVSTPLWQCEGVCLAFACVTGDAWPVVFAGICKRATPVYEIVCDSFGGPLPCASCALHEDVEMVASDPDSVPYAVYPES